MSAAHEPPRHRRSVPIYVGAGGVATASHYAATIAMVELLAMPALAATTLGFALGAAVKYWLNHSAAFRSRALHRAAMPRFVGALALLMALNALLFRLLHHGMDLHYMVAQAAATVALLPPGYLIHRHWVFRAC